MVPHLLKPRKGWENERLASYLLSRFSFVAHPVSIADDLGSDFFCTIFQVRDDCPRPFLVPRCSFAIQVKSAKHPLPVHNKIDYLKGLELPFLLGIVTQSPPAMDIYSADLLPLLFSEHGIPDKLWLKPVEKSEFDPNRYCEEKDSKQLRLRCPFVTKLSVTDDPCALAPKVEALLRLCSRAQGNIAARVSEEHIYDVDGSGLCRIMAGRGSVKVFRQNLVKRLAEVFYNLEWILDGRPQEFTRKEFNVFEKLYLELQGLDLYAQLLPLVSGRYQSLRGKLNERSV